MPYLDAIGAGIVAAATIGFNPIGFLTSNTLVIGAGTLALGLGLLYMLKGKGWGKIIGAGVTIAGVVALATPLLTGITSQLKV